MTRADKIKALLRATDGELMIYENGRYKIRYNSRNTPDHYRHYFNERTTANLIINVRALHAGAPAPQPITTSPDCEILNIINLGRGIKP